MQVPDWPECYCVLQTMTSKLCSRKGENMLISDALSRLSSHNVNASNKSEIAGLSNTTHAIFMNITETRLDSIRMLTSKDNDP